MLLSTYNVAVRQVLRGKTDEVTATVRKSANQALCLAVRHHALELGLKEVDDLVVEMHQSLVHNDRTIRLSAGSVCAFDRVRLLLTMFWIKLVKSLWRSWHFITVSDKFHGFVRRGSLTSSTNC